jgi:hypothetical protein
MTEVLYSMMTMDMRLKRGKEQSERQHSTYPYHLKESNETKDKHLAAIKTYNSGWIRTSTFRNSTIILWVLVINTINID